MQVAETAEAISGRATGVLFFAGFGSLWLCTGLSAMHRFGVLSLIGVICLLAVLVIPALRLSRRAAQVFKENAVGPEQQARIKRVFDRVNTIQWIAILTALVLLNVLRQQAFIVPVIAIIVGLHLFPLARLFRYAAHYLTGALLILWSVGTMVALHREDVPTLGALGTAVILLCSAAYTLIMATRAAKRVLEPVTGSPSA